jgi:hypothetical protein
MAARMVAPVAKPSSTRITVRPRTSGGRATAAVETLAPGQLVLLLCRNRINQMLRQPEMMHELVIEYTHAACRNSAHRQLLVSGDAQLAHDKNVERGVKRAGDFIRDRHAAAR